MFKRLLAGLLLALAPVLACAQMLTFGAGPGGFSPNYTPGGMHFNQLAYAGTSGALSGVVDGSKGKASFWIGGVPSNATVTNRAYTLLNGDLLANRTTTCSNFENCPGFDTAFDNGGGYGTLRLNLNDTTGGAGHQCIMSVVGMLAGLGGTPHHVLEEWDMSPASTSKYVTVYLDGVKQGSGGCTGPATPMLVHYSTTQGFTIARPISTDPAMAFDIFDLYVDFTSSAVDSSNNLSPAEVATFYGGGHPPDITGLCATATFCVRGNASTFAVTGTAASGWSLTGTLYNAAIAPGQTLAHTAYQRWAVTYPPGSLATPCSMNSAGATINVGDLIVVGCNIIDSSHSAGNHNPACPAGFAQQYLGWDNGLADNPTDVIACTKVADAGDAAGAGTYTFAFSPSATRSVEGAIGVYANAQVDVAGGQVFGAAATSSSIVCPSLTATAANDTLINIGFVYTTIAVNSHAAGQQERALNATVGSTSFISDEYLSASGLTGTRTHVLASASSGQCVSLLLKPN